MANPRTFLSNLIKPFFTSSSTSSSSSDKDTQKEWDLEKIAAQEQKFFAFETLVSATKDFHPSNRLGEGGFGPVYKGKLEDGREIAVKKLLRNSNQGKKEFMNEVRLLARVQHRNVVNLLGYCTHGEEKLLVYEYLPHESIDKFLFNSRRRSELDWKKRYDAIVGVARGILYLHEDSHICIIHRDIKASNILLDDKWTPKVADFGMARLFPEDQTHVNTRVAGTNGYMAPEYVMHGQLSKKADVFSFGVLMLELITGHKNSSFNLDPNAQSLLDWAWKRYKKGKSLEIVDATIVSEAPTEQIEGCIKIGLLCTQAEPKLRPTMRRLAVMLSRKPGALDEPTRPGYPGSRYRRSRKPPLTAGSSSGEMSVNHTGTSSSGSLSGESSQTYFSSLNTISSASASANTSVSTSYHTSSSPLSHEKLPAQT
ncbi:hypothetical protein GIB67_002507 [Kingdonia uniflora]|uniref:Protein kinase domain-containing protein n=1 Tax=Kingdonia uniflora TaxID=39325 RepID=A0A7J7N904_9MAGN|nr:hypothetical protein GIB67_002507 [Kingdonia uniflora]